MALTIAQVREHVQTDLVDAAIQRIIDAVNADITARLGPSAGIVALRRGGDKLIYLGRKAGSISEVIEWYESTEYTLDATDYKLHADGYRIERLDDGVNSADEWRGLVKVTFDPADAEAEARALLELNLIRLDISQAGVKSESVGDVSVTYLDPKEYAAQREALFSQFAKRGGRLGLR